MTARTLGLGALFGFVLSRVGATDYDAIRDMFALHDLHLAGVIGAAVVILSLSFWLLKRSAARTIDGQPIALVPKPMAPGLVPGALLFGVGWALAGTCPGTALAQLGEGRWAALATLAGILLSSSLVEAWQARTSRARVVSIIRSATSTPDAEETFS